MSPYVLRLVVSIQNHTFHFTWLNWEIFFITRGFFPHWAHADSSFVGVSVVSQLYTVLYNGTFGMPDQGQMLYML